MAYENFKNILFTRAGGVLTVTLNRPDMRNAINDELDIEILRMIQEVDVDEEVNVLVLTGAGKSFSAGGDILGMQAALNNIEIFEKGTRRGKRILQSLLDLDKPIICRMNGDAIGLGATIALFCDIIIADETARIADPHVKVGLVAGDGGAVIWPQLIGYARAKQYLLTGDLLLAKDAAAMGLINFAVPAAELDAKVEEWANKLTHGASKAIKGTKALLNMGLKQLLVSMGDAGFGLETVSGRSKDHREAVDAFVAKRKPVFTGH
jgi:enoyl-CoA hydratase